jgi:hypothetical protein
LKACRHGLSPTPISPLCMCLCVCVMCVAAAVTLIILLSKKGTLKKHRLCEHRWQPIGFFCLFFAFLWNRNILLLFVVHEQLENCEGNRREYGVARIGRAASTQTSGFLTLDAQRQCQQCRPREGASGVCVYVHITTEVMQAGDTRTFGRATPRFEQDALRRTLRRTAYFSTKRCLPYVLCITRLLRDFTRLSVATCDQDRDPGPLTKLTPPSQSDFDNRPRQ